MTRVRGFLYIGLNKTYEDYRMTTKIVATYYISSGAKNAMYTLRVKRVGGQFCSDNYICNLSTDPTLAEEKARAYYDGIDQRLGQSENFETKFAGYVDFDLYERRGVLSVEDTEKMEIIESGVMPIGKNKGRRFEDMPVNSVLWFADNSKENHDNPVFAAACNACMGVALEKGYIQARQIMRDKAAEAQEAIKSSSRYVGEVKKRMEFSGVVEAVIYLGTTQVAYNTYAERYLTKFVCDGNMVVYFGNKVVEAGQEVKFKATVKAHELYNEIQQTTVSRVKVLE
ncbi:hypothetical protein PHYNN_60 [Pantoea phage Phynn]|nr:hypothetical protein PHYNN_60 [Pantoea phage Phynn]